MSGSTLEGWVLIQAEGKSWLGKPKAPWPSNTETKHPAGFTVAVENTLELSPVYEYTLMLVPDAQGRPQMQPQLRPPFGCMSIRQLAISGAPIWVAVDSLSKDERRVFEMLVEQTEVLINQARAQAAGLTVVPAGTKLPPMPQPGSGR